MARLLSFFPVADLGVEPERDAAPAPVIELHRARDFLPDRESDLPEERRSPRAEISRRDRVAEGAVERLIKIGPPEDRRLADVEGHVLENDAVVLINPHALGVEMEIRLLGIVAS